MDSKVDMFALGRSGHNIIMDWMGGYERLNNRENEKVDGPGIVVVREFTSWLASIMCAPEKMRGHGFEGRKMVKRTPHEPESIDTLQWMIDIWKDHAESCWGKPVIPILSYHWATLPEYRNLMAQRAGLPTGCCDLKRIQRSSFDSGLARSDANILQRWKKMPGRVGFDIYKNLIIESRECMELNKEIFIVDFKEEILNARP